MTALDRRRLRARRIEDLVPVGPGTLGSWVLRYLDHQASRGCSEHTIRGASAHLRYFLVWADERGLVRPEEVTVSVLGRYQRWLFHYRGEHGRPLSFRSQHDRLGSVRRFFRWLAKNRVLEMSPAELLELPRVERRLPRAVLTVAEAERVLAQPDTTSAQGLRDRAILELLYSTGIRRQELIGLSLYDLDVDGGGLAVRQGKGKKDRLVPVGERALAWLGRYLDQVRPELALEPDDGTLFLTGLRGRFSPDRLTKLVRGYVDAAGIGKRGSCHLFRHTMATLMLEGGADLRFIQAMLGHADISTTQIYTQVAIRQLKEVHERTHPGARLARRAEAAGDAGDGDRPAPTAEALLATLDAEADEEEVVSSDR